LNFQTVLADCSGEQININNASSEELQGIIGIGPTYAARIIQNRPFETLDNLLQVKGIGEVTLAKIQEEGIACIDAIDEETDDQEGDQEETEKQEDENEQEEEQENTNQQEDQEGNELGEQENQEENENLSEGGHLNFGPQAEAGENVLTNVGSIINFDASASSDPDNDDLTYYWNLGNGEVSEEESFSYAYYYPGKYLVSLQVSDGKLQSRDSLLVTVLADGLVLSEALPNPEGNDKEAEWIELYNKSDQAINISNWQLDDEEGGSSPFTLPEHSLILPHSYLVFKREVTGISLNNTNDEIRLIYPSGEIADQVIYNNNQEGQSIARKAEQFFWTSIPTPGIDNIIYLKEELLQELQEEIQQPQASSSQDVSLKSDLKKVALEDNILKNNTDQKHVFKAKIPTLKDLDNILKINQVLAQNTIEDSLENIQVSENLKADMSKQEKTFFLSRIIQKPEFILFTSFILSGLILGIWVNIFFKRYV
jgi:competence ComEA-like helix-hairpin-helix protein